ncbi:hypothetical protein [Deinococcus marmoris]|uniref:hypothetical protein n=1 Tax=Deinococcus marmoris TaxID=249408 RepID=UPI00049507AF|nr:hypothetical protein [Deinococcus marmoris]
MTVRLKFDLRGEQTSCTLLAIDLREAGNEKVIFLELSGDRGGSQVIERDPMVSLAMSESVQITPNEMYSSVPFRTSARTAFLSAPGRVSAGCVKHRWSHLSGHVRGLSSRAAVNRWGHR